VVVPVESTEVCADCGGQGWVSSDEELGLVRRCSCRVSRDVGRLLRNAGIPPRYVACRLSGFQASDHRSAGRDQLVRAKSLCRRYVDDFLREEDGRHFCDTGLLFAGPPGVGKTHLAAAVLIELIETYHVRGRFVDLTALTHELQAVMDPESERSRGSILRPIETAEVLVLDELGSQKSTAWSRDVLYNLINRRYAKRLPTLFTTNFRLDAGPAEREPLDRARETGRVELLSYRIPAVLVSRLHEMAQPISLDAVSDYRLEVRSHQHQA